MGAGLRGRAGYLAAAGEMELKSAGDKLGRVIMSGRGIKNYVRVWRKSPFCSLRRYFLYNIFKKGFKEDECYCLASRVKKKTCVCWE